MIGGRRVVALGRLRGCRVGRWEQRKLVKPPSLIVRA
jgi:hypothetical protein